MEVPKDQIATLIENGLYNSAQMLGCFLVSSPAANAETSPHLKVENLVLLGDSLFRDREYRRAIMEQISHKARNLQMNLLMGKLYRFSRNHRSALTCYKECIRHCPYVIEAIIALAELGVNAKDIISLFPQTPNRSGRAPYDYFDSSRWLQRYVEAQCCIALNDYKGGLELFIDLLQRFPNNIHLLLEIAKVEAIIGKNDEAIMNFEKGIKLLVKLYP